MRRLIFFDFFNTFGGAQQSTLTLINKISDLYGKEQICFLGITTSEPRFIKQLECDFIPLSPPFQKTLFNVKKAPLLFILAAFFLQVIMVRAIRELTRGQDASLVVSSPKSLLFSIVLKLIFGSKLRVIYYCRGYGLKKQFGFFSRLVLNTNLVNTICCVSSATKYNISKFVGNNNKIKVTYTSVDFTLLSSYLDSENSADPDDEIVILYAGAIIEAKGIHHLLEAARSVSCQDLKILIAGDHRNEMVSEYYQLCCEIIEKSNLDVEWLGWCDDIAAIIQRAHIVCLPSLSEGLPRLIQEAMYLKKIVIGTSVGGVPDLIEHGVSGFVAAPGSSESLAKELNSALQAVTTGRKYAMGQAAHRHVSEEFSFERQVNMFWKAINE